jgi:hypothetical protein
MRLTRRTGSSLPEYVLPLVLLAVATVAALPNSGNLNNWFQQVIAQTTGGQIQGTKLIIQAGQ